MMENIAYYIFCIVAFIIAVVVLKKVAGCLLKTVLIGGIIALLFAIYYLYFKG